MLKHKVRITVGMENPVIQSGQMTMRSRVLNFLLGANTGVFLLTPGKSVETVEIMELPEGGAIHDSRCSKNLG